MYDITTRIDSTIDRARLLGQHRLKQAWVVPQAFDDFMETFWPSDVSSLGCRSHDPALLPFHPIRFQCVVLSVFGEYRPEPHF